MRRGWMACHSALSELFLCFEIGFGSSYPSSFNFQSTFHLFYSRQLVSSLDWINTHPLCADYRSNTPDQCMQPLGHAYELPSLIANGTLTHILSEQPGVKTLFVWNVDGIGVWCDTTLLGRHRKGGRVVDFEVMERGVDDKGCFLRRVETAGGEETETEAEEENGERGKGKKLNEIESEISNSKINQSERKASTECDKDKTSSNTSQSELPDSAHSAADSAMLCLLGEHMLSEEEKWKLRFVATGAMWIDVDGLLSLFGLTRRDILKQNEANVDEAKRAHKKTKEPHNPSFEATSQGKQSNLLLKCNETTEKAQNIICCTETHRVNHNSFPFAAFSSNQRPALPHCFSFLPSFHSFLALLPTRVSIKQVRRTKDNTGGEESHSTAQMDKLFSDITHVDWQRHFKESQKNCQIGIGHQKKANLFGYICVERLRGMSLKEKGNVDSWSDEGGDFYVNKHCLFEEDL
ncbi:uncharacterized protein MONOS_13766 [Monocercomonoides exilis]|uniref:uncharacterized protein n=1 Tax=Monocercomonoides exilis TaxID=2049356 RepID=UPI003559471F|nr:hypothetical protein MONOS_13766 [Monocercomonoides exilis]|eukprot:MONOS_13766.1-p1 / transcript=MONOS_13766.1 / gene=MONOS_13766 / organism=Monocercomonoides_exilis_PA203 / gene_product=unspecified product / transcript_product=unspecified product / location=Mono_scaffold00879:14363-15862(-) / protein_length=464 / sequence_SO=supercontig / SO=protein_coding / is_pseudo=false